MGQAKAREVFMSGNIFSELDAKKLNIVSEISMIWINLLRSILFHT